MYKISPFTPLFFEPSTDRFGADSEYMQVFASTDQIMLQIIAVSETSAITAKVKDVVTGAETAITLSAWSLNTTDTLYYATLTGYDEGYYRVTVNSLESETFKVTDDATELANTTLIQYSAKDNRQRTDAVFWIGNTQVFFDWRAPGGFKDDNWAFGVESEQFSTSSDDLSDIYSMESLQKQFTLGNQLGCPVWYAALLNRIMSCYYVYFDYYRFVRKEQSVPEMTQEIEGRKSYIFKLLLQQVNAIDETESDNQLLIRRTVTSFRQVSSRIRIV